MQTHIFVLMIDYKKKEKKKESMEKRERGKRAFISKALPSTGCSFLNHSTVGTGFPSPLSQYKEITEPSFIGPKVAPVLNVFLVVSSMTRTNAGWTVKGETRIRSITRLKSVFDSFYYYWPLFGTQAAVYRTESHVVWLGLPSTSSKANRTIQYWLRIQVRLVITVSLIPHLY